MYYYSIYYYSTPLLQCRHVSTEANKCIIKYHPLPTDGFFAVDLAHLYITAWLAMFFLSDGRIYKYLCPKIHDACRTTVAINELKRHNAKHSPNKRHQIQIL